MRPFFPFSEFFKPKENVCLQRFPLKHQFRQSQGPSSQHSKKPKSWGLTSPARQTESKKQHHSWHSISSAHNTTSPWPRGKTQGRRPGSCTVAQMFSSYCAPLGESLYLSEQTTHVCLFICRYDTAISRAPTLCWLLGICVSFYLYNSPGLGFELQLIWCHGF